MSFRTGLLRATGSSSRRPVVANPSSLRIFSRSNSHVGGLTRDAIKKRSRIQSYLDTLKIASQRSEVEVINQYYPALAWEASQLATSSPSSSSSPESSHAISEDQLEAILETLAASGRPVDLSHIDGILADMSDIFGTPPTADTHTAIIRGLIRCQNAQTVVRWFENMPDKPGGIRPTLEHYHLLLEASPEFASFKNMRSIVQNMYKTGCLPDNETYKILLQALWQLSPQPPPPPHIMPILQEMKKNGLPYDLTILNFLANAYHTRGLTRWADEIKSHYYQTFTSHISPSQTAENIWTPRFSQTVCKEGLSAGLALYPEFLEAGGKPSFRIFNALLRHSCTLDDMKRISQELGMKPTQTQWAMMIAEAAKRGFLGTGLSLYQKARNAGISPSAPMVGVLIRALFKHNSVPYTEKVIDKALELYDDLKHAVPEDSPISTDPRVHNEGPDTDIYTRLLHGLSLAENGRRYSRAISSLLEDIKIRGMEVYSMNASIAVMRIRLAGGEEEAFREYQRRRNTLDQTGYERVLDAFCRLSVQGGVRIPSLSRYFNIVKDMRQAGYEVTPQIYTILLRHMGKLGTRTKQDPEYISLTPRLIAATRRIHDLITLDATISPEPYLWNQMMDTYQRLNCFGDAYRVWDQMFISKRFDHVSVSIIFDACGYAKATHLLEQIMTRLRRENFELNLHNWNTYIECLCRMERLSAAVKVLCLDMTGDILPTAETVRIVRSFANKPGLDEEIMNRIQQYQPELYQSLEMEKAKSL
ncbi:hypothetical protein E1B28_001429 [Marasmius oreades]|uniref:Pentatricopeptide repeat-containing protein n=1 Tax=Marasmius oreades TaxID=181124 RepID=A0A9P8AFF3_9AGAR|nr:uncharacterized protein E1B28_001429 [Marasmius oreades]KAG7099599.1 hypothetical protein E1B28_001429 [Marasmius oreades]